MFSGGLVMEFELITNATDAIITNYGDVFKADNNSQSWVIDDVSIKADVLTFDSANAKQFFTTHAKGKFFENWLQFICNSLTVNQWG
jgi:hypothetical protein